MKTDVIAKYLGGHPDHTKASAGVCTITFDDDGVRVKVFRTFMEWTWDDVTAVDVEGPEQVQKRVTASRLLTLGVFAFAAKKKQKLAYVTVSTAKGDAIFECEKATPPELRAKLSWVLARRPATAGGDVVEADPVQQIRQLGELRDQGLISAAEFESKKSDLLDRM